MPSNTSSAVKQLSDGNANGTVLGQSATDLVGFYGAASGVVQPLGYAQTAVVRGSAAGTIATYSTSQSPSAVTTITSAAYSMTVQTGTGAQMLPATGDVFIVNKPTSRSESVV